MGIKSQTTVSRVINDKCSYKAAKDFYDQLLLTNFLHLTPVEIDALNRSLEINRIGLDAYLACQSMWEILLPDQTCLDDYPIQDTFGRNLQQITLASLLQTLQSAESIEGVLFNCCEVKPMSHGLINCLRAQIRPSYPCITILKSVAGHSTRWTRCFAYRNWHYMKAMKLSAASFLVR
jgi:hypothetical protein